jgi:hypothetical protein
MCRTALTSATNSRFIRNFNIGVLVLADTSGRDLLFDLYRVDENIEATDNFE